MRFIFNKSCKAWKIFIPNFWRFDVIKMAGLTGAKAWYFFVLQHITPSREDKRFLAFVMLAGWKISSVEFHFYLCTKPRVQPQWPRFPQTRAISGNATSWWETTCKEWSLLCACLVCQAVEMPTNSFNINGKVLMSPSWSWLCSHIVLYLLRLQILSLWSALFFAGKRNSE